MDFSVRRAGRDEVDRLAPLWQGLYDQHSSLPAMPGVRSLESSWERRRTQYLEWLEGEEHTLLVAERDGELIGYAVVSVGEAPQTWDLGDRVAEIETLSVLESERGSGVGKALTDAAHEVAIEAGAEATFVGVAFSNVDAIRFYEREGFEDFYVLLVKR